MTNIYKDYIYRHIYIKTILYIYIYSNGKSSIQGKSHMLSSAIILAETLQAGREWHYIFKVMKGKNLQPRILYPERLSFRFNREIKNFTAKQNRREFTTTGPVFHKC